MFCADSGTAVAGNRLFVEFYNPEESRQSADHDQKLC